MLLRWSTAGRPLLRTRGALRTATARFRTKDTTLLDPAIDAVEQARDLNCNRRQHLEEKDVEFKEPSNVQIPERFVFVRRVGRGGFGRVLLVREKGTDKLLTLKRVRPNDTYALAIKERMALRHRNVVELIEGFDEGADRVLLFEFCSGPTFSQIMQEPVAIQNAATYFAQLVLALEYLHSQGIVHRDIKPENLLLDGEGVLKLGDLGLAKRVGHSDDRLCGTMAYMSPEMVLTQESEHMSDWWSAGCCLQEMLTGRLPFGSHDAQPAELMMAIAYKEPRFSEDFDPVARDLVSQLLIKDRDARLSDSAEIKAHPFFSEIDWSALSAGESSIPDLSLLAPAMYCPGLTQSIAIDMSHLNELAHSTRMPE